MPLVLEFCRMQDLYTFSLVIAYLLVRQSSTYLNISLQRAVHVQDHSCALTVLLSEVQFDADG